MNIRRAGTAALLVAALSSVLLPTARADDPVDRKREVDANVRELGDQVDESTAAVAAAGAALEAAEAKLRAAQAELDEAEGAVTAAQELETELAEQLAATIAEADRTRIDYEAALASIAAHQAAVASIAREAYIGGDLGRLSIVVNAQSPSELTSAMAYLRSVNRSERETLDRLDGEQRDLAMKRAELEAIQARVSEEQAAAADAVAATLAAQDAAEAAAATVAERVADREDALDDAEEFKAAVEERFRDMQAESDRLADLIAERAAAAKAAAERARERARSQPGNSSGSGNDAPVDLGGILSRPVIGPITSSYGMRYHPILGVYKLHTGTDFGVPTGTSVRSAMGGQVLQSYYNSAYGNRVTVDHGVVRGVHLVTTYNHLSRSTVRAGERLDRGEVLGYAGSTGYSTGPHLHFETLENGRFVNPMTWLG